MEMAILGSLKWGTSHWGHLSRTLLAAAVIFGRLLLISFWCHGFVVVDHVNEQLLRFYSEKLFGES